MRKYLLLINFVPLLACTTETIESSDDSNYDYNNYNNSSFNNSNNSQNNNVENNSINNSQINNSNNNEFNNSSDNSINIGCGDSIHRGLGITIHSAKILPELGPEDPWDWDGGVPSELLDALGIISEIDPRFETYETIIGIAAEAAPILLEGTVPPDPFVEFAGVADPDQEGYDSLHVSSAIQDTLDPIFNDAFYVYSYEYENLCVIFWDEDLEFHDFIGGKCFSSEELENIAGCGPIEMNVQDGLEGQIYSFVIEVESI